jgi:hypothetical protein
VRCSAKACSCSETATGFTQREASLALPNSSAVHPRGPGPHPPPGHSGGRGVAIVVLGVILLGGAAILARSRTPSTVMPPEGAGSPSVRESRPSRGRGLRRRSDSENHQPTGRPERRESDFSNQYHTVQGHDKVPRRDPTTAVRLRTYMRSSATLTAPSSSSRRCSPFLHRSRSPPFAPTRAGPPSGVIRGSSSYWRGPRRMGEHRATPLTFTRPR